MIAFLVRNRAQLRIRPIAFAVLFAFLALTFLACEHTDPKYRRSGDPILQIGDQAARISAGRDHSCLLLEDGSPACWGEQGLSHRATAPPDVRLITISSGRGHVCGLKEDGTPVCWGAGSYGQTSPPKERLFAAISSGAFHTCALREDGAPFCWGQDDRGQASPPVGERLTAIASGVFHTCGLRPDGIPICWGFDNSGQASPPEGKRFVSIGSGVASSCGLQADGTVICWGSDSSSTSPPEGEKFTSISIGAGHGCGLRVDGAALCWGRNWSGEPPAEKDKKLSPLNAGPSRFCVLGSSAGVFCPGGARSIGELIPKSERLTEIASGSLHSCGLREGDVPVCWGLDDHGQASLTDQMGSRRHRRRSRHSDLPPSARAVIIPADSPPRRARRCAGAITAREGQPRHGVNDSRQSAPAGTIPAP